jgi:hypothetical protein
VKHLTVPHSYVVLTALTGACKIRLKMFARDVKLGYFNNEGEKMKSVLYD